MTRVMMLDDLETDDSETSETSETAEKPRAEDANFVTREEFNLVSAERDVAEAKVIQLETEIVKLQTNNLMLTESLEETRKLYWNLRGEPS